jgi:hypothetical protein
MTFNPTRSRCGKRLNLPTMSAWCSIFRVLGIAEPAKQIDAHCLIGGIFRDRIHNKKAIKHPL